MFLEVTFTKFEEDIKPEAHATVVVAATVKQHVAESIQQLTLLLSSELL